MTACAVQHGPTLAHLLNHKQKQSESLQNQSSEEPLLSMRHSCFERHTINTSEAPRPECERNLCQQLHPQFPTTARLCHTAHFQTAPLQRHLQSPPSKRHPLPTTPCTLHPSDCAFQAAPSKSHPPICTLSLATFKIAT